MSKPAAKRDIRYQGAIVHEGQLLLIRHHDQATDRSYWLFPGGGREAGESEEECVCREMQEETGLVVKVERLLMEQPATPGGVYRLRRTFLCAMIAGTAAPGYEPEDPGAAHHGIVEVGWFDLRAASTWNELVHADAITYPQLLQVQSLLGFV